MPSQRLGRDWYSRPTEQVAKDLLGKLFAYESPAGRLTGWIVEVEAYLATDDPACHSARGKTTSNATMFAKPGLLYVYPIHAKHCMNVVTEPEGTGAAVLIRAIEPKDGVELMRQRRARVISEKPFNLTNGPGKTCTALGVDRMQDGLDLVTSKSVWVEQGIDLDELGFSIGVSTRIGISQATEQLLRFFIDGNRFVSGLARDHAQGRNHTICRYSPARKRKT